MTKIGTSKIRTMPKSGQTGIRISDRKYRPKTGHNRSDFRRCTSQDRFGYKWVIKRSSLVSAHGEVDATNIRNPNCLGMGQILERQNLNLFGFRTLTVVYQFNKVNYQMCDTTLIFFHLEL